MTYVLSREQELVLARAALTEVGKSAQEFRAFQKGRVATVRRVLQRFDREEISYKEIAQSVGLSEAYVKKIETDGFREDYAERTR